jgi:hypothetical protein
MRSMSAPPPNDLPLGRHPACGSWRFFRAMQYAAAASTGQDCFRWVGIGARVHQSDFRNFLMK